MNCYHIFVIWPKGHPERKRTVKTTGFIYAAWKKYCQISGIDERPWEESRRCYSFYYTTINKWRAHNEKRRRERDEK